MVTREQLSDSQSKALSIMESGENVFLTGDAGTGKSTLLELFIAEQEREGKNLIACAPTGIAALNLPNGATIHRTFGLRFTPMYSPGSFTKPNSVVETADIIIIDEISMCRLDLFDHIARTIFNVTNRHSVQLIVVGDFYQLPPVVRDDERDALASLYPSLRNGFAFEGEMWDLFDFEYVRLDEVIRQNDIEFVTALDKARVGDASCIPYFNEQCVGKDVKGSVRLVPTNERANIYNKSRIAKLDTDKRTFNAIISGSIAQGDKATEDELELGVGVRVMTLVNERSGDYQNGSLGTIVGFSGRDGIVVEFDNGVKSTIFPNTWEIIKPTVVVDSVTGASKISHETIGTFTQLPVRVAYAITIHKSQGQTYDKVCVEPKCFSDGQLYVALSRCTTIDGLSLAKPIRPEDLMASDEVTSFFKLMDEKQSM